jgi:hypothetical protein
MEQLHEAGAVKFCVNVHAAFALKVAVTVHAAPLAVRPAKEYACGDVKGALNVCVPPQLLEIVREPEAGALAKLMFPFNENRLAEHAVGVAETAVIEQLQEAGAV